MLSNALNTCIINTVFFRNPSWSDKRVTFKKRSYEMNVVLRNNYHF